MEQIELNAQLRQATGKGVARKLRASGMIPAVVYGPSMEPVAISLETKAVMDLIDTGKPFRTLVRLSVQGRDDLAARTLVFRDIQRHHIKRDPLAADLIEIDLDKPYEVGVPVRITGVAPGVKTGGVLQTLVRKVRVKCKPQETPDFLDIDVSELEAGGTLYVEDLILPEGVLALAEKTVPVVTVVAPRAAALPEEEAAAEEAAAEEGEEKEEKEEEESRSSEKGE